MVLAAFINGLHGVAGRQVKYQAPRSLEHALSIALNVTEAEKQEKFSESFYPRFDEAVTVNSRMPKRPGHDRYRAQPSAGARPAGHSGSQRYSESRNTNKSTTSDGARAAQSKVGLRCYNCGGKGHYARVCPTKLRVLRTQNSPGKRNPSGRSNCPRLPRGENPSQIRGGNRETPLSEKDVSRNTVQISLEFGSPTVSMEIEGDWRNLIIDTGSNVSILQPGVSQVIGTTPDRPYVVSGQSLDVEGCQHVSFALGGRQLTHKFLVCALPTQADGLIGIDILKRIGAGVDFSSGKLTLSENSKAPACNATMVKCAALTVFCQQDTGRRPQVSSVVKPHLARQHMDDPCSTQPLQSNKSGRVKAPDKVMETRLMVS
jgi:predicted aspartyl protease